jgi:hypothetical protein
MDCKAARLLLAFCRPKAAELDAHEAAALEQHLAACSPCAALARAEQQIEQQLSLVMRDVPLPPDLRQRLHRRLHAERKAWYRNLPLRHPRVATAVAALLLLAIGLALYLAIRPPRPLDLAEIAEKWNAEVPASREQIQKAFEDLGFPIVAPAEFNYQYLASYDLQVFAGKRVPHLLFLRGPNYAAVYILSGSDFDVRAAVDQPREGSGRFTVELRPGPAHAKVAYLIKYTGGSLDWLLEEEKRSTT